MVEFERQEHDLQEDGLNSFYGFEDDGENQMYEIDRWLGYLLDPGDQAAPVSEEYEEKTAAFNMFGLHLVDETLEMGENAKEDLQEYQKDIRDLTSLGYTEEVRMYAEDIVNRLEES